MQLTTAYNIRYSNVAMKLNLRAIGRCYLPSGRWNSHNRIEFVVNSMLTGRWNSHGSV